MENIKNNINNLTSLWTTVSKPFSGYASDDVISYSQIQTSEWPNKIWSKEKLTSNVLKNIKNLINKSTVNLRFVDFEYEGINNNKLIEDFDFVLTSSLPGMYLKLTTPFETKGRLNFSMVTNASEAKIWCDIFRRSFGYIISEDVIIKSMHQINYYIAYENNNPVGVIKLHLANNVAGIYSLGVPHISRGKGYAKEIMHFILNKSIEQGAILATLQASKLAQDMYEKLGFKKDFTMNSYKLKT